MKQFIISLLVLSFISSCKDQKEFLFNGENLDGWTIFVSDSTVNPKNYFYVNDGMIETVGTPLGYLRTIKEYSDYKLHVEWRYPEEPINSGIFIHTNSADLIWPNHFQAQLKFENAGDFIVHGSGMEATLNDTVYRSTTDPNKPVIAKINPTNEKPAGEWNSYDIICKGNTIEIQVNGLLQNVATDCNVSKGSIGLQAELSKIQFRNLWIEHLY